MFLNNTVERTGRNCQDANRSLEGFKEEWPLKNIEDTINLRCKIPIKMNPEQNDEILDVFFGTSQSNIGRSLQFPGLSGRKLSAQKR